MQVYYVQCYVRFSLVVVFAEKCHLIRIIAYSNIIILDAWLFSTAYYYCAESTENVAL